VLGKEPTWYHCWLNWDWRVSGRCQIRDRVREEVLVFCVHVLITFVRYVIYLRTAWRRTRRRWLGRSYENWFWRRASRALVAAVASAARAMVLAAVPLTIALVALYNSDQTDVAYPSRRQSVVFVSACAGLPFSTPDHQEVGIALVLRSPARTDHLASEFVSESARTEVLVFRENADLHYLQTYASVIVPPCGDQRSLRLGARYRTRSVWWRGRLPAWRSGKMSPGGGLGGGGGPGGKGWFCINPRWNGGGGDGGGPPPGGCCPKR